MVCLFFVSVPGPVAHLTVVESKETGTVAVSWDPPVNEACVEEYLVTFEYLSACNETSKPLVFEIQNTDTAVNITGVPPGASYTLFVFAGNDLGESTTGQNGTTALQGMGRFFRILQMGAEWWQIKETSIFSKRASYVLTPEIKTFYAQCVRSDLELAVMSF